MTMFILFSFKDEPFLMVKKGPGKDGKPLLDNDRYEGMISFRKYSFHKATPCFGKKHPRAP